MPWKIKHTFMYVRAYARQFHRSKIFLHEAPIRSITWKNRDISWITSFPEVFKTKGPICRWNVCKRNVNFFVCIRQAICWMTSDGRLAQTLADQLDSDSGEWIREASVAGGLDRSGAIFPPNLVTAVVKVICWISKSFQLSNSSLAVPLQSFLSSGNRLTTRSTGMTSMVVSWTRVWCVKHGFWSWIGSRRGPPGLAHDSPKARTCTFQGL